MAKLTNFLPGRRRRLERALQRELQFHLDERADELRRNGLSEADARRQAAVEFGGIVATQEEVRDTWTWRWLAHLGRDATHAIRLLRRSPGFSAVAVLILALPIAASSVVFSLVDTALLEPGGGRREALTAVYNRDRSEGVVYRNFSYPLYLDLRDRSDIFDSVMAHTVALVGVQQGEITRRTFAGIVSSNYFSTLGTPLVAGRTFTNDEERSGHASVAIASHAVWRQHGLSADFVGSEVRVNGYLFTVVGVAPPDAQTTVSITPEWWFPLGAYEQLINQWFQDGPAALTNRANHALFVAGALRPGVTRAAADERLDALAIQLGDTFPATDDERTFVLGDVPRLSLTSEPPRTGPITFVAGLLALMAVLVLAVACLNLANLMLARGAARRREFGIRQAIGGGRSRLVAQLLIEGLTLSLAGAAAGIVLAWWAQQALSAWLARAVGLVAVDGVSLTLALSWRTIAVASMLAVVSTVCFALGPAWRLTRPAVTSDLKDEPDVVRRFGSGGVLVGLQLAVSMALLAVGGLFIRSATAAGNADPGFGIERLLVFSVDPSLGSYDEPRTRTLYGTVLDRVQAMPGVEHAGLASKVTFGEFMESGIVATTDAPTRESLAGFTIVTSTYFNTVRLPILQGRGFTPDEDQQSTAIPPALISEPLARRLFPDGDVLGRPLTFRRGASSTTDTVSIVGVVPGTAQDIVDADARTQIYLPFGARFRAAMVLHVATGGVDLQTMLSAVQRELRQIDPQLPILSARTMAAQRDASIPRWAVRAAATIFGWFGAVALLIATLGVYGLHAYEVARRTRELGIRQALGATTRDITTLVIGRGLKTTAAGLVLGLVLAIGIGSLASSLLYRVSPLDPFALGAAALVLGTSALIACYVPARRATRISAMDALRTD
ncbi:MAG: ABC transporter permease [Acidobacteria bacterium]|nr:ABC transporter permease [Acidobacteriota bacterium]